MSAIQQAFFSIGGATGIQFKSIGTDVQSSSPTVGLPTSHSAGDLLVIVINGGLSNVTAPAGWSVSVNTTTTPRLCVFYKIDSGAESSVAITGGGSSTRAVMLAYSGTNASPLDVNGTSTTTTGVNSLATASLTTSANNSLVLSVCVQSSTSITWTDPVTGCTTRFNSGAGNGPIMIVDEIKTTAGATTARTFTSTATGALTSMACSFKV